MVESKPQKIIKLHEPCPKCTSSDALKRARNQRWILKHPEKYREINAEQARSYRKKNPERLMLIRAKARAKEKNLPFDISLEDVSIPSHCPVLGIKLKFSPGSFSDSSPSLDQIEVGKGYIKNNVRVISHKANRLKSNMSFEDCKLIFEDFKNVRSYSGSSTMS